MWNVVWSEEGCEREGMICTVLSHHSIFIPSSLMSMFQCAGLVFGEAFLYLTASSGMQSWTGFWWRAGLILGRGDAYGRGKAQMGWRVGLVFGGVLDLLWMGHFYI